MLRKKIIIGGFSIGFFKNEELDVALEKLQNTLRKHIDNNIVISNMKLVVNSLCESQPIYEEKIRIIPSVSKSIDFVNTFSIQDVGNLNITILKFGELLNNNSYIDKYVIQIRPILFTTSTYTMEKFKYSLLPDLYKLLCPDFIVDAKDNFFRVVNILSNKESKDYLTNFLSFIYNFMIIDKKRLVNIDLEDNTYLKSLDFEDFILIEFKEDDNGLSADYDKYANELNLVNPFRDYEF